LSDQEIEVERVYTIPLSRAWITARHRRTRRAVNIVREFAVHHMKSSEIKIDTDLNEFLWKRGITKPPRRITVKMEKDEDGVVTISLPKETKKNPEIITSPVDVKKEEGYPVQVVPSEAVGATPAVATESTQPPKKAPKSKKGTSRTTTKKKPKDSEN